MTTPGKPRPRTSAHLLRAALAALWLAGAAQAQDALRIEAMDGGVLDLGGITQIVGRGQEIAIRAEGAGSRVTLTGLSALLTQGGGAPMEIEAAAGGVIQFSPERTQVGAGGLLHLTPDGQVQAGTLGLDAGASLTGQGTLTAHLDNGGLVSPGDAVGGAGRIAVTGDYRQGPGGQLTAELGGAAAGSQFDQLAAGGALFLGGTLAAVKLDTYVPAAGSAFEVLTGSARTGTFAAATGLAWPGGGTLTLGYSLTAALLRADGLGFQDHTGPTITGVAFDGVPLAEGLRATRPGRINLSAADPSAVGRVTLAVDGTEFASLVSATDQFAADWAIDRLPDGPHTLTVTAFDTYGNPTTLGYGVIIALAPPPAPIIARPADGFATNDSAVTVVGSTTVDAQTVTLYRNGAPIAGPVAATLGNFAATLVLPEGPSQLRAAATNRGGAGGLSTPVNVMVDKAIPEAPIGLYAQAREAGQVHLTWSAGRDAKVTGYEVYRASAPFDAIGAAVRVNTGALSASPFDDLPSPDGIWYYRVVAVNAAGTRGAPSNLVSAAADSVAPVATAIRYTPRGPHDPASGRIGVGSVEVALTLSEPVRTTPFLTIAPAGGLPQTIALTRADDTRYLGRFEVGSALPSGTAYAVFSARDQAGNRGSEVLEGATLLLDTQGPAATDFRVQPADPIRNAAADPVAVTVTFGVSEPLADGSVPALTWQLSGAGREPQDLTPAPDGSGGWRAALVLPADAGRPDPEALSFRFQATDDLDNPGTQIQGPSRLQVYQDDLPPPAIPTGLTATALPDGEVRLGWTAVEGAADYQVYRAAAGEGDPEPLVRSDGALAWTDRPGVDGLYRYAVASVRRANGQEGRSAPSAPVEVKADAHPPAVPSGLVVSMLPVGVQAAWQAPPDPDPLTYALYRTPGGGSGPPDGSAPVRTGIDATSALDAAPPPPLDGRIAYAVAALDPAGNRSAPTDWRSVAVDLLPVATLDVEQAGTDYPVLAWTHPRPVAGFDLYLGAGADRFRLNPAPLTGTGYQDLGWSGGERLYTLVAVDGVGGESLGRALRLPALGLTRTAGSLKRGLMNRLSYRVDNTGTTPAADLTLALTVNGRTHASAPFACPAGGSAVAEVVVGGYADLPDLAELRVALEQTPNPGERVRIVRQDQAKVTDGVLLIDLLTRNMIRGGTGQVRFSLENIADLPIQVLTAGAQGTTPSQDIRLSLLDQDGNDLGGIDFKQAFGAQLRTLPDGRTVAEIPPGGRFESDWLDLPIPAAAPSTVELVLAIDRLHYHLGQPDAVSIKGLGSRRAVTLTDTSYLGELIAIDPEQSTGAAPIAITGRARHRESGAFLGRVPLNLIIAGGGFERTFEVVTDEDGTFSYRYAPLAGDSGTYRVSVVHPDLLERPEQGSFTIGRVFADPARRAMSLPRDRATPVEVRVTAGRDFPVTNLRLLYLAEDQTFGGLEPGITVTPGAPIDLAAEQGGAISLTLSADSSARDTGVLILRLTADQSGTAALALIRIDYTLSEARPALSATPSFLELGAAPGDSAAGRITLANQGLAPLQGLRAELILIATGAKPDWAFLATPADLGDLAIGAERPLDLTVRPTESVPEGIHELAVRVTAANLPDPGGRRDIPVYVAVTRSGVGSVLFHCSDIYTATLDADGNPIPGLRNAVIEVQNEKVSTIARTGTTDARGELLFADLPAGSYLLRASAPNHEPVTGRLSVQPGVTQSREVFLGFDLITIEWEVIEIPLEDRYEIVLTAVYETDVPAPVVVIEPPGITLPPMVPGQVIQGSFTITNYGLVRADGLSFTPAPDDQYFDYSFLAEIPESLGAKERVTVPYRIVALRSLDAAAEATASGGGGSCAYASGAWVRYHYDCANGISSTGGSGFSVFANVSASCGTGGYWWTSPVGGGGGGSYVTPSGWPVIPCPPDCKGECCNDPGGGAGGAGGGGGGRPLR